MTDFFTTETLGLLSAGLLIVGVVKFILYYKAFNVEILKYIDSSEILLLFADNISVAATAILFLLPPYVFTLMPYVKSGSSINCSFYEMWHVYWFLMDYYVKIQIILFLLIFLFSFTRSKITNFERMTYVLLAFIIIYVLPFLVLYISGLLLNKISPNIIISLMLVVNFFIMIMLATYNEIYKVKRKGYFSNTKVILEGLSVPAEAYYIGQVKSFIFFYNPRLKQSIAFKSDVIKEIYYKPAFRDRNLMLSFWRKLKRKYL